LCIGLTSRTSRYIAYPQTDTQLFIFNSRQQFISLMCLLYESFSYRVHVSWLHNNTITYNNTVENVNSTTLLITNPQPSDAGVYQCVFGSMYGRWTLNKNILLLYGKLLQIASYSHYVHGIL